MRFPIERRIDLGPDVPEAPVPGTASAKTSGMFPATRRQTVRLAAASVRQEEATITDCRMLNRSGGEVWRWQRQAARIVPGNAEVMDINAEEVEAWRLEHEGTVRLLVGFSANPDAPGSRIVITSPVLDTLTPETALFIDQFFTQAD